MKIKYILTTLFLILFLSKSLLFAGTIKGFITDKEKGIPLIGANIFLESTTIGAASDEDGKFLITNVASGKYQVIISMIGYERKSIPVTLNKNNVMQLDLSLHSAVLQLANVTVTGKAKRDLLLTPNIESAGLELSTTTITQKEIQRQGSKTLVDALNFVPGALIETRGRKVKQFFSIRGQTYPYPEYSINGVWQREFLETSYFYPATDIKKIEVVRSSAALLTGINGMAGVINIIPREYNAPETSLSLEYGTFGTYRSSISHGAKIGSISYAAGIGIEHTDGPSDLHAKEEMMNFNANIKWTPSKDLTVRYFLFHLNGKRELRLAEYPAADRFLTELGSYDPIQSTLTNIKVNYKITQNSNTEFLTYYTKRDPVYIDEDEITHKINKFPETDWEWGVNLIHSQKLTSQNTLRIGGLYNHWAAPNGKRFYYGKRNDLETISFVVVDEHNFGSLNMDAGFRYSQTYINEYGGFGINGSGKGFAKVEPLVDIWQPPIMHANIGGSYALPNLYSLNIHASVGEIKPLPGSLDIDLNEPKNETRYKLDFGVRKIWNSIGELSFVGFLVHQKDALVLSGKTYNSPGRYMELYVNRDQNQYGIEVEARFARIFNSVEIFFNTTLMNSIAESDGDMVENLQLPKIISSGGIYFEKGALDMSLLTKYVSSFENTRFAASGLPPQPLGNYVTLDGIIGWSFYGNIYSTRFYLEIKNITDKHYSTVVGYPDFGRTITVGIRQVIR